jgi:lysylphosphatidylglycerol synthetase-like protein (DUF2156 family)
MTTIFFAVGIRKPTYFFTPNDDHTYTTVALLRDSIPSSLLAPLHLENVSGIKIQWSDGRHRCFFQYTADTTLLLEAIKRTPISMYGNSGDVDVLLLEPIAAKETWEQLAFENITLNLFTSMEGYEVQTYKCNKFPFTHTLVVHPQTNQVIHCIEFNIS